MLRVLAVGVVLTVLPAIFIGDVSWFWRHGLGVGLHHLPYRDFVWEFPPLTAPVLGLVRLTHGHFALFFIAFTTVMVTCELLSLRILRRSVPVAERRPLTAYWTAIGLPLATIAWFRFDFLAVLFAVIAYTQITRGRRSTASVVAGVAAKLWPGALVVLLIGERKWREVTVTLGACAALVAGWYAFSPTGFHQFWSYRRGNGLQLESVAGALKLLVSGGRPQFVSGSWAIGTGGYGWVDPLGMLALAAVAALVIRAMWRRPVDPARVCAALTMVTLLGSHLLSPQYLVWPLPFMALLWARGERRATLVYGAAALLTVFELARYHALLTAQRWMAAVVVGRNMLLVVAAVWLLAPVLRVRTAPTVAADDAVAIAA